MKRIYVGITKGNSRAVFKSDLEPTQESHWEFGAVIGPFRTMKAAKFCRKYPNSPCQSVAEFERAVKKVMLADKLEVAGLKA